MFRFDETVPSLFGGVTNKRNQRTDLSSDKFLLVSFSQHYTQKSFIIHSMCAYYIRKNDTMSHNNKTIW